MKVLVTIEPIDPAAGYWPSVAARLSGTPFPDVVAAIRAGQLPAAITAEGWRVNGADLISWMERRT